MGCASCACPPRPFISSITPASASAGGNQFLLTINGSDFRHDSIVVFNGFFLTAAFIDAQELVATIPASDIAASGTVTVFVFNPSENGGVFVGGAIGNGGGSFCRGKDSNALFFTIQ